MKDMSPKTRFFYAVPKLVYKTGLAAFSASNIPSNMDMNIEDNGIIIAMKEIRGDYVNCWDTFMLNGGGGIFFWK